MRRELLFTLSLLILAAPARLLAQTIPSPFRYIEPTQSVSLYSGYIVTGEDDIGVGPQSLPVLGAQYSLRFSGPVSGVVGLSGGPTARTVYTTTGTAAGGNFRQVALGESDFYLLNAEAGLRFHLTGPRTWRGIAPYVGVTAGGVVDLGDANPFDAAVPEAQRINFGPGLAVGASAGTEWFPTERISIRLDARDYVWRIRIPPGLRTEAVEETEWTHNLGLTLGAAFHF